MFRVVNFDLISFQDFHRPSPYQSPESISPFRSTFASQRSLESPTANGYNSSRTSYHDYPTSIHYDKDVDVEVAQETNSRGKKYYFYLLYSFVYILGYKVRFLTINLAQIIRFT